MQERPRYSSLRDYVGLLRRRRLLIALVAVGFALVGLGLSLAQSPTYTARASIVFRDVVQDLPLIGGQGLPAEAPAERAARNAETITSLPIARAAKELLETEEEPDDLAEAVTTRVGLQTNFVIVEVQWEDAEFSADVANAFAVAATEDAVAEERKRLRLAIRGLQTGLKNKNDEVPTFSEQAVLAQLAQLRTLNELTSAGEITERAETPAEPTSPRPVRNTVLGLLVGLAFGIVAAFGRDSLDRRLRTARDIHDELDAPILGRISGSALGSVGLATERYLSPQDQESFRVLRTNLAFWSTETPPRTVLVTSGLPQEGKSTVAAALATASAAAGRQTLLVDCDLRRPTLAERLGLNRSPGLAEYLSGRARPQEILQTRALSIDPGRSSDKARPKGSVTNLEAEPDAGGNDSEPRSGPASASFVCVTSGTPPEGPSELLASERCHQFIEKVGRAYELVVIDTSPMLATVDPLQLIPYVDAVLIVVRFGSTTREELRAISHALGRLPEKLTGIVLTGFSDESDQYEYYGYEA